MDKKLESTDLTRNPGHKTGITTYKANKKIIEFDSQSTLFWRIKLKKNIY